MTETVPTTPKSRNITTLEFFEKVQEEYIQAELRHRIYTKEKDQIFWQKVMDGKKATIEKLANNYSLPSIFTHKKVMADFMDRVYRSNSYPLFTYRSAEHQAIQQELDLKNYYSINAVVKFHSIDGAKQGTITRPFRPEMGDSFVTVWIEGKEVKCSINSTVRIFN